MPAENPKNIDPEPTTEVPIAWRLMFRFAEKAKSNRFSGYKPILNDISGVLGTHQGQDIWQGLVEEARRNGGIRPLSEEEKLDKAVTDFVKRHPIS